MTSPTAVPIRRRAAAAALAVAAALGVLVACGTSAPTAAPAAANAQATTPAAAPARLTTIDGRTVTVPATRPTAVFFFTVGCGECVGGAASLATAARTMGDKAAFLAVDMDPRESTQQITSFLTAANAPTPPAAIDTDGALWSGYQVASLSTLIVIDSAGRVTYRATDPEPKAITAALTAAGAT